MNNLNVFGSFLLFITYFLLPVFHILFLILLFIPFNYYFMMAISMKYKAKEQIKDEKINQHMVSVLIIMMIILSIVSFYTYLSFTCVKWYYRYPIALWVSVVLGYLATYPELLKVRPNLRLQPNKIIKQTILNTSIFIIIYASITKAMN